MIQILFLLLLKQIYWLSVNPIVQNTEIKTVKLVKRIDGFTMSGNGDMYHTIFQNMLVKNSMMQFCHLI